MADTGINRTISRKKTGFPEYLDFEKLRESAVRYLGELSGKIWTDHNEHDPGITILESLIYALMDLGYRSNLPAGDIFTRDPAETTPDNNFFTASRILGNNPLTITDYRKLLVDLEGVKNAWLEPDNRIPSDFCKDNREENSPGIAGFNTDTFVREEDPCKCDNLNGLYHVFIQLEDGIDKNKHQHDKILGSIKDSLMAHRNLCEDFIDIKVLCKLEIGICAEIDLTTEADTEDVYMKMVETLQEFLSPSPRFYSLQQLLERKKTIDEIFSGRPYNLKGSHGFVDVDEFENLKLRKELHLSDVYHLLSEIKGIKRVRNLGWIKCCNDKKSTGEWRLELPENNIPSFSPGCSGFIFTRNGLPVKADLKKFDSYFEVKNSGVKKAWYDSNSSFLNPVLPRGVYRNDLADYYSVQNELPRVYAIKEGSLGEKEPDKRKAQALQLQGFLLFFDQLLANYLAQLKNMRSLFSLTSGKNPSGKHTYFINQLTNAPKLEKLLRFRIGEDSESTLGSTGSILAYPVSRQKIEEYIGEGTLKKRNPEGICTGENDFPYQEFCFSAQRDIELNQLKDDFLFGEYEPVLVSSEEGCWYFYFFTTSSGTALISKNSYKDQKKAADAAASVKYAATFTENYRPFMNIDSQGKEYFSFDIELNLDVYSKYLQLITEDKELYLKRRQGFLNHLLSRFAENFTDFALLSAPFKKEADLPELLIKAEERFLSHYDDLSSNRGKAYDYLKDKWKSNNTSGFEKRVKAIAGIENLNRHYLCNFIVEPADKLYKLSVALFDMVFSVQGKTFDEISALASLKSLYNKWLAPDFEYEYASHEKKYRIFVRDDFNNRYSLEKDFLLEDEIKSFINTLETAFKFQPDLKYDVFISRYIHKILFTNDEGQMIAESNEHFEEKQAAEQFGRQVAEKMSANLKDVNAFTGSARSGKLRRLIPVRTTDYPFVFLNEDEFELRQFEVFHLKEKRKRFSLLNKKSSFQFDSVNDYPEARSARDAYKTILSSLPDRAAYKIAPNRQTEEFEMFILSGDKKLARFLETFSSGELAEKRLNELLDEIKSYTYRLSVTGPMPDEWEFKYRLCDHSGNFTDYLSRERFKSYDSASNAATDFHNNLKDLRVVSGEKPLLVLKKNNQSITAVAQLNNPGAEELKKSQSILASKKRLYNQISDTSDKEILSVLEKNRINPDENFIYKLVDKDNLLAFHPSQDPVINDGDAGVIKNNLITQALAGYNYIDIVIGADVTRKRKHNGNKAIKHHYLIKCNNRKYSQGKLAGKELILLESTKGYDSQDDAVAAFRNEYLLVLKYSRFEKNYGPGRRISTEELLLDSEDALNENRTMVFIPKETSIEFGNYEVQKILAPITSSYPIRYVRNKKFVFVLGNLDQNLNTYTIDWKSCREYSTPDETMERFLFLLTMLKYPGNFYVERSETRCVFNLFIREVLAVSAHGFQSPEEAWGTEGVEKFICVSQSDHGFHNYENRQTCNPGFYVACSNTGLRHPCTYDTASMRDHVMDQLYQASGFNFMDLVYTADKQNITLNDLNKKPLAVIHSESQRGLDTEGCDWLIRFAEAVYEDRNFIKKGGSYYLVYRYTLGSDKQERYLKLAEPAAPDFSLTEWKKALRGIVCYFPVRRMKNACDTDGKEQYGIQVKLPGFDRCEKDDPCYTPQSETDCTPGCHVSWVSDCCFETCCQALDFYLSSLILIRQFNNYRRVFECDCGPYGIEIRPQLTIKEKNDYLKETGESLRLNKICYGDWNPQYRSLVRGAQSKIESFCFNEIVAINPQFYSSTEMVCDAVGRAKKLINDEGLHLVEHILLRPGCIDENGHYEECDCNALPRPHIKMDSLCQFQWKPGGETDPCESGKTVCLTPGCDPYSFIATVILPAWPERFRSESGKKTMEKLLQREAPAHVLLRILWLRPRDFCCAEFYYKLWIEWLGHKLCDPDYSNCNFHRLLFDMQFQSLPECRECIPCYCDDKVPGCSPGLEDPCDGKDVLTNINYLYGWSDDPEYNFRYCESGYSREIAEKREAKEPEKEARLLREKSKLAQSRAYRYEKQLEPLKEAFPDKEIIGKAMIFLKKSNPDPEVYSALAEDIMRDKTNTVKGIRGLNRSQKQLVIESITWKYLDAVCFKGEDLEKIQAVRGRFRYLKEKGIDVKVLYEGWDSGKLAAVEPEPDLKKIKKWILGQ